MNQNVKHYFQRVQLKPAVVAGHVVSVGVDANTGQQTSAQIVIGGNTLQIKLDPFSPLLANGDAVRLAQYGTAASAEYRLAGLDAGARPMAGVYPMLNDNTNIGGVSYNGGDLIVGKLSSGNLFMQYDTGRLYHRIGAEVYGIEYPDGSQLFGHAILSGGDYVADGPNVLIASTNIKLRNGTTDAVHIDTNGTLWADKQISVGSGNNIAILNSIDANYRLWIGNATAGSAPFRVSPTGDLTATSAVITGTINMTTGSIVLGSTNKLWLNDAGDGGLAIGGSVKASAPFRVTNAGALTATNATITGTIDANAGYLGNLTVDGVLTVGTGGTVQTANFASGTSGWRISNTGDAEFANLVARGAIRTAVFEKSLVTAFAGSQMVSKSASTLAADVTLSGTTFDLLVRQQGGGAPFANGDLIYLKTEALATYATVNAGSASGSNWQYTATYKSGSNSGTIKAGETVIDFGPNGVGRILSTADQTNAPYLSIATHDMATPPVWTERARLGNLNGIAGASGYGLWSDNCFLKGVLQVSDGTAVASATDLSSGLALKVSNGGAATDINTYQTTISGGKITTGSITAAQIAAGAITADKLTVVAGAPNLLSNSTFDRDSDADGLADDWVEYNNSGAQEPVTKSIVASGGVDGGKYQRLTWSVTNTTVKGLRRLVPWKPSTTFIVSFYAKASFGPTNMNLRWAVFPVSTTAVVNPNLTTNWQRYVFRVTTAATVDEQVYISIADAAPYAGTLDFDQMQIEEADVVSGWKLLSSEVEPGVITGKTVRTAETGARVEMNGTQLFGTDGSNPQWYINGADGKFQAGGGNVVLDSNGLQITGEAWASILPGSPALNKSVRFISDKGTSALIAGDYSVGTGGSNRMGNLFFIARTLSYVDGSTIQEMTLRLESDTKQALFSGDLCYTGNLVAQRSQRYTGYIFIPLASPLTSTSWAGNSFSTASKTLITLSNASNNGGFDAPAGIKAVLLEVAVRDSGSSGATSFQGVVFGPNNTANAGVKCACNGVTNDAYVRHQRIVPCNTDGDIYYQTTASGSGTLDVIIEILGYWI